jgi:phosphocarrier protein
MCNTKRVFAKDVVVVNELGLHARSAARIAELAKNAKSKVWVQKDNEKVDAKSIIDILTLACEKGSKIQIIVEDASDKSVLDSIVRLAVNGFGE